MKLKYKKTELEEVDDMGNTSATGRSAIDMERFVPVTEVASVLQISYKTVLQAIDEGILPIGFIIPPKKDGGKVAVRISRKKWEKFRKDMGI